MSETITPTLVNGLPLPAYLLELMAQGRWKRPSDIARLSMLFDTHDHDFSFLKPESMERETQAGIRIIDAMGEEQALHIYGITSFRRGNVPIIDPTILDVDQAILVIVNHSEEGVFLDYRNSLENPVVVISVFGSRSTPTRHVQVATNIQSFAEYIGL